MIKSQLINNVGNNYICYNPNDSSDYFKVTILSKDTYSYGEYKRQVTITDCFDESINALADWYITNYLEIIDSSAYYNEVEKHIRLWLDNNLDIPIELWIYNEKE